MAHLWRLRRWAMSLAYRHGCAHQRPLNQLSTCWLFSAIVVALSWHLEELPRRIHPPPRVLVRPPVPFSHTHLWQPDSCRWPCPVPVAEKSVSVLVDGAPCHAATASSFGCTDRVSTVESGVGEGHLQRMSVPICDRRHIPGHGLGKGQGRLGLHGLPEGRQVAPQQPLNVEAAGGVVAMSSTVAATVRRTHHLAPASLC